MLTIDQLTFGYQGTPLFRDLSFSLGSGELTHIKGPNGAGKSTLLSVITGLLQADAGDITWSPGTTREYLPAEGSGHFLRLSAEDNLRFWLSLHGLTLADSTLASECNFWRLDPRVVSNQTPVQAFSTGMKRKLGLARVRLSGTKLWLLDEPVSGLDDHALGQFHRMVAEHLDAGGSALIVSHDLAPIKSLVSNTLNMGGECP